MARIRRADISGPGIRRRRRGRGWEYLDEGGERIDDLETLDRIRELAIPPAWKDVWICPYPNGHIQAVGTDAAGRRQYRYHQKWRERRDQIKFDRMTEFARALPALRAAAARDIRKKDFPREKVLACAVRLLDRGFFRIGGEEYAEENESYGLATMQKRHVRLNGSVITFDYPAKSGKRQVRNVVDPEVYDVVCALKRRRGGGPELLAYHVDGSWFDVKSSDINAYIKEATGGDFTAKDFRTWSGTVLASVALAVSGPVAASKTGRKKAMARAVQEVAHYLGNTPAVARASYIDPRVFDRYCDGVTIGNALEALGDVDLGEPAFQGTIEEAVLDLIEDESSSALEKVA